MIRTLSKTRSPYFLGLCGLCICITATGFMTINSALRNESELISSDSLLRDLQDAVKNVRVFLITGDDPVMPSESVFISESKTKIYSSEQQSDREQNKQVKNIMPVSKIQGRYVKAGFIRIHNADEQVILRDMLSAKFLILNLSNPENGIIIAYENDTMYLIENEIWYQIQ